MFAVFLLDAVSVPLVERMLDDGRLPALAALRARGRWQTVASPAVYFGDRETAHSGVEVADHGQTFPLQWSPAEQRLRFVTSFPVPEAVWERVARAGGRSLVVDPYEGRPPARPVGTVVSGWQFAHTAVLQRWASPKREYRTLSRRFGRAPEVEDVYGRPSVRGLEILRRQLLDAPHRVARLTTYLLSRQRYDLAWVEFSAGHMAGHHFWDLAHLVGGHLDERRRAELEATVAETYAAIDTAMGEILSALPPGADILVFSEVGMAANHSRSDLLPEMLARVLTGARTEDAAGSAAGRMLWHVRAAVPARARMTATRILPNAVVLELGGRLFTRGVDWRRTRAFALPSDHDGYVRLNLRGRERDGIVDPGDTVALIDEIRDGLASFFDHDGTPCVAGVDRVEDLVGRGARSGQLPDLIVRWTAKPVLSLPGVTSPRYGDVRRRGLGIGRSGNHVDGSWVLTVPGSGRMTELNRPPRLVDVAATVSSLLGADAEGLAGEPLLSSRPACPGAG
jgi:predicted AlkP superfamily phosphohydrolase/phosphomutase